MTENKKTVERYLDRFNKSDHEQILLMAVFSTQYSVTCSP
jgi:hypothetical protein